MGTYNIQEFTSNECLNQLLFVNDLYVGSDRIQGHSVVHKYGHNLDVNNSYETVWSTGGEYSYLTSPTVLKISSGNTNDTSSGTGARTVLVQGLNADYGEIEEIVTLNGQTAVNTSKEYFRVFRMIIQTTGSGKENAGIIYAGTGTVTSGVPANIYAAIPATYNQTMMAVYTVPANKTAYVTMFYAQPDSQSAFQTQLLCADESGIFKVRNQLHAFQSQALFTYRPYLKLEEKQDIEIRAKAGIANVEFAGGFSLILIDNN